MNPSLRFAPLVLATALFTGVVSVARAQIDTPELVGLPVRQVEVTLAGSPVADLNTVLEPARAAVTLRPGDRYSIDAVRDTLQNIHALQLTSDVDVEARRVGNEVVVTFRLEPQLRLWTVRLSGDLPLRRSQLRRSLSVREGAAVDDRVAAQQASRVQQALSDQGYLLSEVVGRVEPLGEGTRARLELHVRSGSRTRVEELRLEGAFEISPGLIREALGVTPASCDWKAPSKSRRG
jgi:outer membrane protein assembly factor BamA